MPAGDPWLYSDGQPGLGVIASSYPSLQSPYIITMETKWGYESTTIKCPDHRDCILNCYAYRACYKSTFIGPANAGLPDLQLRLC